MKKISKELREKFLRNKSRSMQVIIQILDFNENLIREIGGTASQGNIQVDGNASARRTLSLTMFADKTNNNLENLDNIISLNKKVSVQIGLTIPGEEVQWFQQGVYIISKASLSASTSGVTISISGKDKSAQLDGTSGGTLPSSVVFHQYEELFENGESYIYKPTIYEIIREAVHYYGGESYDKIHIFDLDVNAASLVKYIGSSNLYFNSNYSNFVEADDYPGDDYVEMFEYGDDVGYLKQKFIYPNQLILNAGDTVATLLNKICQTIGNYEWFYNLSGEFIFQQKRNYLLSQNSINDFLEGYISSEFDDSITDEEIVISANNNPDYDNIKNDFIVLGKRKESSGITTLIKYHYAIDEKPSLNLCKKYMYIDVDESGRKYYKFLDSDNINNYFYVYEIKTNVIKLRSYGNNEDVILTSYPSGIAIGNIYYKDGNNYIYQPGCKFIGYPCEEWREELYRQAIINQLNGEQDAYYDAELLANWREIYDTTASWGAETKTGIWDGWNPIVQTDPGSLKYWLDFLTEERFQQYSIKNIGRRSVIKNNESCGALWRKDMNNIYFVPKSTSYEEALTEFEKMSDVIIVQAENDFINQKLAISSRGITAIEIIEELLAKHLIYNTSITLNTIPLYWLEPNTVIYIFNEKSGIQGRFLINKITIPLNYNGTMQISATQAVQQF